MLGRRWWVVLSPPAAASESTSFGGLRPFPLLSSWLLLGQLLPFWKCLHFFSELEQSHSVIHALQGSGLKLPWVLKSFRQCPSHCWTQMTIITYHSAVPFLVFSYEGSHDYFSKGFPRWGHHFHAVPWGCGWYCHGVKLPEPRSAAVSKTGG